VETVVHAVADAGDDGVAETLGEVEDAGAVGEKVAVAVGLIA